MLAALGIDGADSIAPVTGGWDTALWKVRRGDQSFALRVFRTDQVETCQRELRLMRLAASAGVPVPTVHAVGAWNDRPALLLSWCDGRPLLDEARDRPDQLWRLGVEFGRCQARIHQIKVPAQPGEEPERWIGWAGPDERILRERLQTIPRLSDRLLHLDYHPLNVLIDQGRVTGVIDWANARSGDPRADLARTYTILRVLPIPGDATSPVFPPRVRAVLARAWRMGYRQIAGPVDDLGLFLAWAGAAMLADLSPKVGRPGIWLTREHLAAIARWTARWKRRAGIRDS